MLAINATNEQLLSEYVACGAPELLAELYRRLYGKVVGFLLKRGVPSQHADDIAQEAFIKVMRYAKSWRNGSSVSTWLLVIARNCNANMARSCDYRRMLQADKPGLFDCIVDHRQSLQGDREEADELCGLMAAIDNGLDARQADVVRLLDIEGMNYEDTAARLGIPTGTVRSRRHRAVAVLRRILVGSVMLSLSIALGGLA